jgi:hypothetical protein
MDFLGKIAQAHKKASTRARRKPGREFDWDKQKIERVCLKIAYVGKKKPETIDGGITRVSLLVLSNLVCLCYRMES